jgi:hypothetical protein
MGEKHLISGLVTEISSCNEPNFVIINFSTLFLRPSDTRILETIFSWRGFDSRYRIMHTLRCSQLSCHEDDTELNCNGCTLGRKLITASHLAHGELAD